jgi:hypothetical protein
MVFSALGIFWIAALNLCFSLKCVGSVAMPPRFMISSLHGVKVKGQLDRNLAGDEAFVFMKNAQVTKDGSIQVTKICPRDFIHELNDYLARKVNSSILFFVPDKGTEIEDVFLQCKNLQYSLNCTVIPCLYTPHDIAHSCLSKDVNKIADERYIAPSKKLLGATIHNFMNRIQCPVNFLAHGYGACFLFRLNELKLNSNKPIVSNLFLAAPVLGHDFFSPINKLSDSGSAVKELCRKIHIFYAKDDSVLKKFVKESKKGNGEKLDLLGLLGPIAGERSISKLNCNCISFLADPFRQHIYFDSEKCLDYMKGKLLDGEEENI